MLYSVLEQIEMNVPDAEVLYNPNNYQQPIPIETKLKLKYRSGTSFYRYFNGIFRRLGIKSVIFTPFKTQKIDVLFDAGGFQFSDQWKYSKDHLAILESYYRTLSQNGTKIIFLPQALGPFENEYSKKCVDILNKYATIVYARERVSYDYIKNAGFDIGRLKESPDFTLLTSGVTLPSFSKYKDYVCIIPNKKMITNTDSGKGNYINFVVGLIEHLKARGEKIFLLNHEGLGDLSICDKINDHLSIKLEVVTGLNALEVKGVIKESKLVISSRFHGVASALSQGVPCLATSWNHKYEMLFKEYDLSNKILKIANLEQVISLVDDTLENLDSYKEKLSQEKLSLKNRITFMWRELWESLKQ